MCLRGEESDDGGDGVALTPRASALINKVKNIKNLSGETADLMLPTDDEDGIGFFKPKRKPKRRMDGPPVEFGKPHTLDPDVQELKASVLKLISTMDLQAPWFIIDPRKSKWLNYFDLLAGTTLIYVAIATPLEVAFVPITGEVDTLFLVNHVTDGIFAVELVLQFFVMYQSEKRKGVWVHEPRAIARNYLTTWFGLDAFSIIISLTLDLVSLGNAGSGAAQIKFLRVLRTLRLAKMLKLLSSSRLWVRWQMEHAINYGMLNIFGAVMKVLMYSHYVACIWGLQASVATDLSNTWLGHQYGCISEHEDMADCFVDLGFGRPYARAFYFAVASITSIGYGDVHATATNALEVIICTLIMLSGSFLWAVTLGTIIGELTSFDSDRAAFRFKIDSLNTFMRRAYLPQELQKRLREYVHRSNYLHHEEGYQKLMKDFSPVLQAEVAWTVNQTWLSRISFLNDAPREMLVSLSLQLRPMLFAPSDLCPPGYLYLVQRGIVLYRGRLLSSGRTWGEDLVMSTSSMRQMYIARAMTFLEVHYVTRNQLLSLAEQFPAVFKKIRWTAIWWGLKRELILLGAFSLAEQSQASQREKRLTEGPEGGAPSASSSEAIHELKTRRSSSFAAGMLKASNTVARDAIGAGALAGALVSRGVSGSPGESSGRQLSGTNASFRDPSGVQSRSFNDRDPRESDTQKQFEEVRNQVRSLERKQTRESKAIMDQLTKLSNKIGTMHDHMVTNVKQTGSLSESWVFSSTTNPLAA